MHRSHWHMFSRVSCILALASLPMVAYASNSLPAPRDRGPACNTIMIIIGLLGALDIFCVQRNRGE
jgi:hypothetical protein